MDEMIWHEIPPMSPSQEAELIKEGARIDPTTGRLPEDLTDPLCDHCGEEPWTTMFTLTGEYQRTRRLGTACTVEFLEWV